MSSESFVDEYNALALHLGATETQGADPVWLDVVEAAWKTSLEPGCEDWCRHALNVYAVLTSEPVHLWGELMDKAPIRTRCGLVLPVILTVDAERVTCPQCAQAFAAAVAAEEKAEAVQLVSTGPAVIKVEKMTLYSDMTRRRCPYYECDGPDGKPFTNTSLTTLRRVLCEKYGRVELEIV